MAVQTIWGSASAQGSEAKLPIVAEGASHCPHAVQTGREKRVGILAGMPDPDQRTAETTIVTTIAAN